MSIGHPRSGGEEAGAVLGCRILDLADRLAAHSESETGLTCTFMSQAHRRVAAELCDLMGAAGLSVAIDAAGNVIGRYACDRADAPVLIVGSHYDTVRDAGKYDGRLGILTGIVAAEELRRDGVRLPFHVDVIAFSEEEGVRFSVPYIGSAAVTGRLDAAMLARCDGEGRSVAEVIGADGSEIESLHDRGPLCGYLEIHIEQGPVLLHENRPLGIVAAVAGQVRHRVRVTGTAGHAGTVPMSLRHDAAAAAAEIVSFVEQRCAAAPGVVGTVGQLSVPDGAVNVIPGRCDLSLDIRAGAAAVLADVVGDVLARIDTTAARRGVAIALEKLLDSAPVTCAPAMQHALADAMGRHGLEPRYLVSGAGHDAVMFDGLTDIGMLFVRCGNGGISHSPLETVTAADAEIAARVMIDFLVHFTPRAG